MLGAIIGSGIFINPGLVAATVPRADGVLALWALGGAIALGGALCYAELGARRPRAGGQYLYLAEALHPLAGFLYGWALLLVIQTGAMAAVAITFARYLAELCGWAASDDQQRLIALLAIALLSAVNYLGLRPGALLQNALSLLRVAALLVLVAIGLLAPATAVDVAPAVPVPPLPGPLVLLSGMAPVLFAYGGWQQLNYLGGEVRAPQRNVPRALVLGTAAVVAIYLLVNVAYLKVLGAAGLARSHAPASDAARVVAGPWGARFVALAIAGSTFGFLHLSILAAPRVYYAMARDGLFFRVAARVHPRRHVPGASILLQSGWVAVLLLDGPRHAINAASALLGLAFRAPPATYAKLLHYVVFADWIFFGLTALALFGYRRQGRPGGFRTPGYPLVPAAFALVALAMVVGTVAQQPDDALRGLGLILTGVPVFLWWRKTRPGDPAQGSEPRSKVTSSDEGWSPPR